MREEGVDIAGASVTILGAGGAGRAIAVETALAGAKKMTVINRSQERGQDIITVVNDNTDCVAEYIKWDGTTAVPQDTDILVNATSVGLYPDTGMPDIDMDGIAGDIVVCDVIPNPPDTPFLKEARRRGAKKTISGMGMLVYQGAIGFELWTGEDAPVDVMMHALKDAFSDE